VRITHGCAVVATLTRRGHRGTNRFRFDGRVRGDALTPGGYTLSAFVVRRGRVVPLGRVRVVVGENGVERVGRARPAPSCGTAAASFAGGEGGGGTAAAVTARKGSTGATQDDVARESGSVDAAEAEAVSQPTVMGAGAGAGGEASATASDGRMLGIPTPFDDAPAWLQPLLLAALAGSILLLLAAATPVRAVRPAAAGSVVVHRRPELALAGAVVLATVAVAALLL